MSPPGPPDLSKLLFCFFLWATFFIFHGSSPPDNHFMWFFFKWRCQLVSLTLPEDHSVTNLNVTELGTSLFVCLLFILASLSRICICHCDSSIISALICIFGNLFCSLRPIIIYAGLTIRSHPVLEQEVLQFFLPALVFSDHLLHLNEQWVFS